eukprot:46666_1
MFFFVIVLLLIPNTQAYKIFGGKYLSDPKILLWSEAETYCQQHCNSHLASIHSNETFEEILNLAAKYWHDGNYGSYIWFGLKDAGNHDFAFNDNTSWDYGTTLYQYPWSSNSPAPDAWDSNCVAIFKSDRLWGEGWCDSDGYYDFKPFICDGDCIITNNPTKIPSIAPLNTPTVITSNPTASVRTSSIPINSTALQTTSHPIISTIPTNKLLDETAPFVIALTFICLIISILILYDFIAAMKWHQWERKRIKYLGGCCLLMYSLSLLFAAISHTLYLANSQMEEFIGLYEFQLFFWGIAKCLTYTVFIERLRYLFENTGYQSNQKVTRTLYISIGILGITHIQFMILSAAYYQNKISNNAFIIYRDIQVIINCLLDGLISIVLFYLFVSKLFKISQNIYARNHENVMVTAERVDEYNTIFFNSTIRLTVLSLLPVCVTLINFILETVLAFNSESYVGGYNIWLWSSTSIYLYLLDTMSCIVCIYMTFSIENAKLMYVKCCKGCDKMCRSVSRKRNENYTQMTDVTDNYFELTDDESNYSIA